MDLSKPLPVPTPVTQPFWDGLAAGEMRLQRCRTCQGLVFYPRLRCSHCLADTLDWHTVSGTGTLYTFTVARVPTAPQFADETPQLLAVVELDEGVRLTSTLIDCAPEDVRIGMRVEPVFDPVADGVILLRYRPAASA